MIQPYPLIPSVSDVAHPSIGRIVHYFRTDGSPGPWAAVVTATYGGDIVALHVFPAPGEEAEDADRVPFDRDNAPGTWCWPPRS